MNYFDNRNVSFINSKRFRFKKYQRQNFVMLDHIVSKRRRQKNVINKTVQRTRAFIVSYVINSDGRPSSALDGKSEENPNFFGRDKTFIPDTPSPVAVTIRRPRSGMG